MVWVKGSHPSIAGNWKDRDSNEKYWWNRPNCLKNGCGDSALSFSSKCWDDLREKEKKSYRQEILRLYAKGISLQGLNLWAIDLEGADLRFAHLEGANLGEVNLEGADLFDAHLEGANLGEVNLEGADLFDAHLEGADLRLAHLERASLWRAHLEGADLWGAHLEGADLRTAHLQGASLDRAYLEGANLIKAYLEGAYLRQAHLQGANLDGAYLEGADLSYGQVGKYVKSELVSSKRAENISPSKPKEPLNNICYKLERVESVICKPSENISITNFSSLRYNPHTRLYFHLYACLKWLLYYIQCKLKGKKVDKKRLIGPYRQTKLIGIDTTDLDWSKHPQLIRDIHYQQFLDAFKNRSWFHKYIMYPLWGITSYFGEMLSLWLFWAGAIITGFALAFLHSDYISWFPQMLLNGNEIKTFTDGFYLSGLVFTSLGLGSFVPANDAAKWWILAEVMLGFIMLGSLVSFFANKFVRRD